MRCISPVVMSHPVMLNDKPPVRGSYRVQHDGQWVISTVANKVKPLVQLDFEDLELFEAVTTQYQHLGVIFTDAIALKPSNPSFQRRRGDRVLVPRTQEKSITLTFEDLVERVGAYVTGAKPIALTIFDQNDQVLAHTCTYQPEDLMKEEGFIPQRLKIEGVGIAKAIFHSEAPFTLDDLFFVG